MTTKYPSITAVPKGIKKSTDTKSPKKSSYSLKTIQEKDENAERLKSLSTKRASTKKLQSSFGDVIMSLKSHRDRKLEKELQNLDVRKRNREIEHFLAQRKFFLTKVFTTNNELRFTRLEATKTPTDSHSSVRSDSRHQHTPPISEATESQGRRSSVTSRSSRRTPSQAKSAGLRELLFLDQSPDMDTPNRKRILQAEKVLLGHRSNSKRSSSCPSSLQADIVRLYKEQPLARELSKLKNNEESVGRETMVRFDMNEQVMGHDDTPSVSTDSHCTTTDVRSSDTQEVMHDDQATLRATSQQSAILVTPRELTLTLDVDRAKPQRPYNMGPSRSASYAWAKPNQEKSNEADRQERLIKRIMLTVPPKMIAKATAHSHALSNMMGYSQQKATLIEMEKKHGRNLGREDQRFQKLMLVLGR